ncbi:MAG: DUF2397 domain-containing protein, partial [Mycobacteriales bacterium]
AQYRVIVDVLLTAQDASLTGMSFDEIRMGVRTNLHDRLGRELAEDLLAADEANLDARLNQLVRWEVLIRWQDQARTGEDFLRRRDRYQLTPLAARLHSFWTEAPESDEDAAADLTLAPRAIHDRLEAFSHALTVRRYPVAASEYQQVITTHQAMAVAARTWQRSLAHAISGAPDPDKQDILWLTLQSYIAMWGEQVDVYSSRIAALITGADQLLDERSWRACVRTAMADDSTDELVEAQAGRWARTWVALGHWFSGAEGQARRLRRQLRDLVAPWARNTHILLDTGGAVTRRAELVRLAEAIERAPDEDSAWTLWDTAVGIFPARHLLVVSDAADDHAQCWVDAPAAPIEARFREHGTRAAVGRRARLPDYATGRAAARRSRAAALAARAEAETSLLGRSGTRLSDWPELTDMELDLLLELFRAARRHPAGNLRYAVTGDGRWKVTLTEPQQSGGTTQLICPSGRLATVDWLFELEPAG